MKKFFTLFVGMALGLGAYAQTFDSDGLTYSVLSSEYKTCAVTGPNDYYGEYLTIPETVSFEDETYTVTEVGSNAFSWSTCRYIQIPTTMENIGNYGFWNIHQTSEISLPSSVKEIGFKAFGAAFELHMVNLGESSPMIASDAFGSDTPIAVVYASSDIPAQFEDSFLSSFPSNPAVFVPQHLVEVYQQAWEGATVLADIPVNSISFPQQSYQLQPGGVLQLAVDIDPENASVIYGINSSDGISLSRDGLVEVGALTEWRDYTVTAYTSGGQQAVCYISVSGLEHFTSNDIDYAIIPGVDHEVELCGLYGNVEVLDIPETVEYNGETYTVTTIKDQAFYWRTDLIEVTIPASIKSIGKNNFNYCRSLMKVTIADSEVPLTLGEYCFTSNSNLESVYLGRNFTGAYPSFRWNDLLSTLILGPKVTEVAADSFFNEQMFVVESHNPVPPVIGEWAFGYNIQHIYVAPENVEAYIEAWGERYPYISASVEATAIDFEEKDITIYTGQRLKLPLIVEPADASVFFTSSDIYLLNVDSEGYIYYYPNSSYTGVAIITATTLNGLKAECRVAAQRWFTFAENTIVMEPGTTRQIEVDRTEAFGDEEISWYVEEGEDCVEVDPATGLVTALAGGNAIIVAQAKVPGSEEFFKYPLRVEVRNYPQAVTAVDPVISVWSGYEVAVNLNFEPEDDEYLSHALTWTVENPEIAEVINYGNSYSVRGLQGGTTVITGETPNGLTVEIEVVVKTQISEVNFPDYVSYLAPGESLQLEFTTVPEVTNTTFTYFSGDESIVTIDENGLMTGVNPGYTYVYVNYETPWGSSNASHRVNVCIMPEEVTLANPDEPIEVYVNEHKTLDLIFAPMESGLNMALTWQFDNDALVGVGSYIAWNEEYQMNVTVYEFHGIAPGETHFVGTTVNGKTVEGTVIVKEHPGPENVILENPEVNVVFRNSANLLLNFVSDAPDVNQTMTWTVADRDIAEIYYRTVWNEETQSNERVYYVEAKHLGTTEFTGVSVNDIEVSGVINVVGLDIWYGDKDARRMNISVGETVQLEIEASSDEIRSTLNFRSYDEGLFTVTPEGEVTGVAPGENWIDANYMVNEENCYDDIWVVVHPTEGVAFSRQEITLTQGEWGYVTALLPLDAEYTELTWECSNPDVINFSPGGTAAEFRYFAPGEAVITATTPDGYSASCVVRCAGLTLNTNEVKMGVDMTRQLTAELLPMLEDVELSFNWFTYDPEVATVEDGVITAVSAGTTTVGVEVYAYGRWLSAYATVYVIQDYVAVTGIQLSDTYLEAKEGEQYQLTAYIEPADATVDTLEWSSSDESVATVNQDGLVTIISEGSAIITVSATDGSDIKAECYVTGLSGIDAIFAEGESADIYNMSGILVKKAASADDFNRLAPGIYIIRKGNVSVKIVRN